MSQPAPVLHKGIVKQVLSGDSVIIREQPRGGPPPEKNLGLSNVTAPKLCRRPTAAVAVESRDEPCAWESREFLRKQLIGKEVLYSVEYNAPGSQKHYGCIYLKNGDQLQNITEQSVMEGFLEVKRGGIKPSDDQSKLIDLEEAAKAAEKGKWAKDASEHVRNIHWSIENPKHFVDANQGKEFSAIIEHVRDGCTVRAFLLPDFYHVTVMMSGIKTPMFKRDGPTEIPEPFAEEAKFFTESRLLQKEVKIRLDGVSNANFLGTIIHPAGSIAQLLLREGFARCVDWSMSVLPHGHDLYRSAERLAKQMKKRIWKDYEPSTPSVTIDKKEFTGKVTEVINADAIVVKTPDGSSKKLFLSSLRPPRLPTREDGSQEQQNTGNRRTRPLYDVPYMFEAREFMRKKLIGKKVNVAIDYIKAPSDGFPEKTCATVTIGTINVAEALISKGLATVVRHRQDDDQRSSHYDELLSAETRAAKNSKGLHSKKEAPTHRISEVSGDASKAKQFLPFLQRAGRISGIVEFVASGSRLRVYLPKETCLITLLLAGIECPRMQSTGNQGHVITGEPYGEDAYTFTRELCLQKDVEIEVSACDRAGNFIGWLFIDDVNLSLSLVKEGLSTVHFSAEKSQFYNQIVMAEENAKTSKLKIWSNFEEPKTVEIIDDTSERQCKYEKVLVTEVESPQCFWVQHADSANDIEQMMERLRTSLAANPPVPGSYTPRRGELCAALFSDNNWYRARVLKTSGPKEITVIYIDFGNIEVLPISKIRALPGEFTSMKPQAVEYNLALVREPNDEEMKYDLNAVFKNKILNNMFLLNKEYKINNQEFVTLTHPDSKDDIGRSLIAEGLALVDKRNEKRFQKIIKDYFGAQESAKKNRLNMWRYGDITEDDAKEFGYPTK